MKKQNIIIFLISILFLLTPYQTKQETIAIDERGKNITINATVISEIEQGKDGSVWKVKTFEDKTYNVLISYANLGDRQNSKDLPCVNNGSVIQISGEIESSPFDNFIIARKLKIQSYNSPMSMLKCQIIYKVGIIAVSK